jgi:DNA-binding transcriptional ArsR family regulator
LPGECDLAEILSVSRSSVSEELIALEPSGYVEVRLGSGVYVTMPREGAGLSAGVEAEGVPVVVRPAIDVALSNCSRRACSLSQDRRKGGPWVRDAAGRPCGNRSPLDVGLGCFHAPAFSTVRRCDIRLFLTLQKTHRTLSGMIIPV